MYEVCRRLAAHYLKLVEDERVMIECSLLLIMAVELN